MYNIILRYLWSCHPYGWLRDGRVVTSGLVSQALTPSFRGFQLRGLESSDLSPGRTPCIPIPVFLQFLFALGISLDSCHSGLLVTNVAIRNVCYPIHDTSPVMVSWSGCPSYASCFISTSFYPYTVLAHYELVVNPNDDFGATQSIAILVLGWIHYISSWRGSLSITLSNCGMYSLRALNIGGVH